MSEIDAITDRDHPHACGDKNAYCLIYRPSNGSSPRVWGQELPTDEGVGRTGIIPTRVGTSQAMRAATYRARDHPHACGDKKTTHADTRTDDGSSPRVWGQVTLSAPSQPVRGIIPTRVGTSYFSGSHIDIRGDHPHACGDKAVYSPKALSMSGSSPRVWGQD